MAAIGYTGYTMIDIQIVWGGESHAFSLEDGEHQVGRSSDNAIHLPAPRVSKVHASLRVEGERMWVRDLGSTNGTEVNGRRVHGDEVEVPAGTLVSFAGAMMRRAGGGTSTMQTQSPLTMTGSAEAILSYNATQGFSDAGGDRVLRLISGLFELLAQGKGRREVEEAACAFVADHITADRVVLMGEGGGPRDVRARWTRDMGDPDAPLQLSSTVIGRLMKARESVLVSNPMEDEALAAQQSIVALNLRSAMAAPLFDNERVRGILYVDTSRAGVRYTQADLEVLTATANAVAVKLRNIHFESELETAGEIQRLMMPAKPALPGYDLAARCEPARGVGGDYFDFIVGDGLLALAVGDVSGKGLPAALLMANTHATMRAQTQIGDKVSARVGRANRLICETTSHESFVTLFYGELDVNNHRLTYCNAGHEHPFLVDANGRVSRLGTNGLALGVIGDFAFEQETHEFKPGDLLVVYSDGVTDTPDDNGNLFGIERLRELIASHRNESAADIATAIVDAATAHGGGKVQFDDLTALVLRRDAHQTMI
jgi:hypothetical protein